MNVIRKLKIYKQEPVHYLGNSYDSLCTSYSMQTVNRVRSGSHKMHDHASSWYLSSKNRTHSSSRFFSVMHEQSRLREDIQKS